MLPSSQEAEVQRVLRYSTTDWSTLRQLTQNWTMEHFDYADSRIQIDIWNDMLRGQIQPMLLKLRDELRQRMIDEAADRRHRELLASHAAVASMQPKIEVKSEGQSGGITAHIINYGAPSPQPPEPPKKSIWEKWQVKLAVIVAIIGILSTLGVKLDFFAKKPEPAILSPEKPHTSIKSENQSGGITAGSVSLNTAPKTEPAHATITPVIQQSAEPKPQDMNNDKPTTTVSSDKQLGGVTAANIGTVNVNTMQPQVEGVRVYVQQVSSPREDAPYALQIAVQVAGPVQPFGLAVICDKEITQGSLGMVGNSVFQNVGEGFLNDHPKTSYFVTFRSPAVTPSTPLLVTIMCKEPFNILRVQRMNP